MTINIDRYSGTVHEHSNNASASSPGDNKAPRALIASASAPSQERKAIRDSSNLAAELLHLRSICGEDDSELLTDMIDGETSLESFVGKMIELIGADEADSDGIKAYQQKLAARKRRLDQRAARLRVLLASVVTQLPGRKFRHALASVSAFDVDPKVLLLDESQIPTKWWKRPDPVVDHSALRKHLLERERLLQSLRESQSEEERQTRRAEVDVLFPDVPGVSLGNGEISVRIFGN
jgi:hypothetical protein